MKIVNGRAADNKDYGSTVRNNLMKVPGYAPYCPNSSSFDPHFVRAQFDGEQFKCRCGWRSEFPDDFMEGYKKRRPKLLVFMQDD